MPKNKENEFNVSMLELDISKGIDLFIMKHGFTTDYQCEKACGLNDNSIRMIRKAGSVTLKTMYRLGRGVGYKARANKSEIGIVCRVIKDFEGK